MFEYQEQHVELSTKKNYTSSILHERHLYSFCNSATVRLTSIHPLQIEAKSHVTVAWLTNLFMVALTSSSSELVNATIKKVMAPLEVGPTFGFN